MLLLCGAEMHEPSMVLKLKCSPKYDRALASSLSTAIGMVSMIAFSILVLDLELFSAGAFWRKKWELGQANSFGIGERPVPRS